MIIFTYKFCKSGLKLKRKFVTPSSSLDLNQSLRTKTKKKWTNLNEVEKRLKLYGNYFWFDVGPKSGNIQQIKHVSIIRKKNLTKSMHIEFLENYITADIFQTIRNFIIFNFIRKIVMLE